MVDIKEENLIILHKLKVTFSAKKKLFYPRSRKCLVVTAATGRDGR